MEACIIAQRWNRWMHGDTCHRFNRLRPSISDTLQCTTIEYRLLIITVYGCNMAIDPLLHVWLQFFVKKPKKNSAFQFSRSTFWGLVVGYLIHYRSFVTWIWFVAGLVWKLIVVIICQIIWFIIQLYSLVTVAVYPLKREQLHTL